MGSRWRARLLVLGWSVLGGVVIAGFFVAAFFRPFSPVDLGEGGAVILLVPLVTGLLLGILLAGEEIVTAAVAGLIAATVSVGLVALFISSPAIAGVADPTETLFAFSISRTALSAVILFPIIVVGSVLGRGLGDLFLPTADVQSRLEALREETRLWHEALERLERRREGTHEVEVDPPAEPSDKD